MGFEYRAEAFAIAAAFRAASPDEDEVALRAPEAGDLDTTLSRNTRL